MREWKISLDADFRRDCQGVRAVDDEQTADRRVETSANQRLADSDVLARRFHHPEWVLVAVAIDADQQDQVLIDVDAIDLREQKVQSEEVGGHPLFRFLGRQRHEAAGYR